MERRTVLGLALAAVVEARGGDVGVSQPFLDLGDVGLVGERVVCRRRAHRMHA